MATLIGLALIVLILALPSFVPRFPTSLATPGAWVALGGMFLLTLAGSMLGLIPLGIAVRRFVVAFVAVFALAALAQTVSAWNPVKTLGPFRTDRFVRPLVRFRIGGAVPPAAGAENSRHSCMIEQRSPVGKGFRGMYVLGSLRQLRSFGPRSGSLPLRMSALRPYRR